MATLNRLILLMAALLTSANVHASDKMGESVLVVENGWARATAPGQDAASVDMTITSKKQATLIEVSSPAASAAAMHSMKTTGGMMTMREVESIEIHAGKKMILGDSGYHLMLTGLKNPLKAGEMFPMMLSFKMADGHIEKIKIMIKVGQLTGTKSPPHDHEHMDMLM